MISSLESLTGGGGAAGYLRSEMSPRRLLPSLTSGLVAGVIQISICLSFAAMVYSGVLSPWLSLGISAVLAGGAIMNVFAAVRSSAPGLSSAPQDGPAAVNAVLAASIAAGASVVDRGTAVTVLAAIGISTAATGLFFWVFGRYKVGGLVRFIPYPVIGGFLAGTGWLLFIGSVKVMTGSAPDLRDLGGLFRDGAAVRWLPGVAFGLAVFLARRRSSHYLVLPAMLLGAAGAFYLVLAVSGRTVSEALESGFLLTGLPEGVLFDPFKPGDLALVDWPGLLMEAGNGATLVVVSLVQFLLYISGLEISIRRDLDLDLELRAAGGANVVAGLAGSVAGYPWPTTSILAHRMGAKSRLVGLVAALLFVFCLFSGAAFLPYFPKLLMGGILAYIGIAFLAEWVYDAAWKLPAADYLIVLLILGVIGAVGFLEGVAVGLVGAVVLFAIKYSRIRVVKNAISGSDYRSNRDRAPRHMKMLKEKGGQTIVLKLQGFIFFGTASTLLGEIKGRSQKPGSVPLKYVALDFRQVSGLDSSALLSFLKLRQFAEVQGLQVAFSNLTPEFERQLGKEGFDWREDGLFHLFPDLDHAMEWIEERILVAEEATFTDQRATLAEFFKENISSPEQLDRIKRYFGRESLAAGHALIKQGENARELFFVESGWVTVVLELPDGKKLRLRTMGPGTVVGETALYMGTPRTASVVTDVPSVVHKLTQEAMERMEREAPDVAATFHRFLVRNLAERLGQANQTMKALLE